MKYCLLSDEIKDLLAGTDLCKYLIHMAQVNIDDEYSEENQTKVKLASDLLILLLTGGMYSLQSGGGLQGLGSHWRRIQRGGDRGPYPP